MSWAMAKVVNNNILIELLPSMKILIQNLEGIQGKIVASQSLLKSFCKYAHTSQTSKFVLSPSSFKSNQGMLLVQII